MSDSGTRSGGPDVRSRIKWASMILILACAAVYVPAKLLAVKFTDRGTELHRDGKLDEAIAEYRRALKVHPWYGPARRYLRETSIQKVDRHLLPHILGRDSQKRKEAIEGLKELGPDVALVLLDRLEEGHSGAYRIAVAIVQMRNPGVVEPAAKRLRDPGLGTSRRSAYEIVLRGFPQEARETVDELHQHECPAIRESAVRVLRKYRDLEAARSLHEALKDSSSRVRVFAASELAKRRAPAALPALLQCLKDSDRNVRMLAAFGLRNLDVKTALPHLVEAMADRDSRAMSAALSAVSSFKEREATAILVEGLKRDRSRPFPYIGALQQQVTPEAAKALGNLLNDDDQRLSRRVARALQRMRTAEAKEVLRAAGVEAVRPEDKTQRRLRMVRPVTR